MASVREWIALTLSALLFSVVAGYGVGRALNAKYDAPATSRAASIVAIVDRTGEPSSVIGSLSAAEIEMPSMVTTAPIEAAKTPPPRAATSLLVAEPVLAASPATGAPASAPAVTPPTLAAATPLAENASVVISFADQRLYLMADGRPLASFRVKFGFDPARVKPGDTKIQSKSAAKQIELGWKSFPLTADGERGFILSQADFETIAARLPIGAQVTTTRERIGAANAPTPPSGGRNSAPSRAIVRQPAPASDTPANEPPAIEANQPAFLASASRTR
jgi:hypothetical protein